MKKKSADINLPPDSINYRIRHLVKVFGSGKNREFARLTGIHESTLSSIITQRMAIPETVTLDKIIMTFSDVNREWLMSGKGPMLKAGTPTTLPVFNEQHSHYQSAPVQAEEVKKTKKEAIRAYLQKKIEENQAKAEAFKRELRDLDEITDIDAFLGLTD